MTIQPAQNYLLIRMQDLKTDSRLVLPETSGPLHPHGKVLLVGPFCEFTKEGDLVLFLPQNLIMGFNEQTSSECFLLPETAVIGKYVEEVALES